MSRLMEARTTHYRTRGMNYVRDLRTGEKVYLTMREPVQHFIDAQQPPMQQSCDWLRNPTALGLLIFPRFIYQKMEDLRNENQQHSER